VEDAHILFIHIDIFINLGYIGVRKTIPLDMKKGIQKIPHKRKYGGKT
jgi:hypothetical protein